MFDQIPWAQIVLVLVIFLVTMEFLKRTLFKAFLIQENLRSEQTIEKEKLADETEKLAVDKWQEWQETLSSRRKAAELEAQVVLQDATEAAGKDLDAKKKEASDIFRTSQAGLVEKRIAIEADLQANVETLSKDVVEHVLA